MAILSVFIVPVLISLFASLCVIIVAGFVAIRFWRNKTYRFLKQFPGYYEDIPLVKQVEQHRGFQRAARESGIPYGVFALENFLGVCNMHQQRKEGLATHYIGGVPIMIVLRADYFEKILTHSSNPSKSKAYKFFEFCTGKSIFTSSGDQWKTQRKMLTPSLHFSILEQFAKVMNRQAEVFVDRLAAKGKDDCVTPYLSALTLDIVSETLMGTSIDSQNSESGQKYLKYAGRVMDVIVSRLMNPIAWVSFIHNLSQEYRDGLRCLKVCREFTMKVIEDRKNELLEHPELQTTVNDKEGVILKSKKPFLDLLLQKHFEGAISLLEVRDQVDTFLFAGQDTTALALTYVIYLIGLHPEVQQKLHEEVDELFSNEDDNECDITFQHISELKYMEMVIKESQRIYPSVPAIARNLDEDVLLEGKVAPKGTQVVMSIMTLHRDPDMFPKPDEFIPERFSPEESAKRSQFAFLPFSAGPRNCIGQKFAMMVEKIVLCWLLRRYSWVSLDPRDSLHLLMEITMRPTNKMRVHFEKRSKRGQ